MLVFGIVLTTLGAVLPSVIERFGLAISVLGSSSGGFSGSKVLVSVGLSAAAVGARKARTAR